MDTIEKFWRAFEERHVALAAITSADEPVYDEILEALQAIDDGLWFEIGSGGDDEGTELIITASGNAELFPLVDKVVAKAPVVPGWTIIALKPKTGFPPAIKWDDFSVTIADVRFQALSKKGSSELALKLFVPDLDDEHEEDAGNALLTVLDHALGERAFVEQIARVEVAPLSQELMELTLPLTELEQYLKFRKRG